MTGHNTHSFAGLGRTVTARVAPWELGERPPHGPGRTDSHSGAQPQLGPTTHPLLGSKTAGLKDSRG